MSADVERPGKRSATPGVSPRPVTMFEPNGRGGSNPATVRDGRTPVARHQPGGTEKSQPALPPPPPAPGRNTLRVLNGAVYFNGDCEACRPFCAAACCKGYAFVSLTEEEATSGRYAHKEASPDCDCTLCSAMRAAEVQYALWKRPDGSCFYLDGTNRCSIYEDRPETCRTYTCVHIPFRISP